MYTTKQRVYFIWLSVVRARQLLDKHAGDQVWFTSKKDALVTLTGKGGRKYQQMSLDGMAHDLIAMIIEETHGLIKAVNKRVS